MTRTAGAIAAGDLSQRVPAERPGTEASELGDALNSMMTTIEDAFAERTASEARLRRFVADASHELRTPVTTIRGYAELYRHGGLADTGELDQAMRRTEQEAVRMASLVDDLLLLARLDEGRPLACRTVDLGVLGVDAAADARAVAPDRVVTADVTEGVTVEGDEDRLRQVVGNLVGNALVHTPDGTAVSVRVHNGNRRAVVEVHDDGPGMAPDVADARVRAVLARRRVAFAPRWRRRARSGDRARHRRGPRRRRGTRQHAEHRHDGTGGAPARVELRRCTSRAGGRDGEAKSTSGRSPAWRSGDVGARGPTRGAR